MYAAKSVHSILVVCGGGGRGGGRVLGVGGYLISWS